jgi:hypothetical protein
MSHGKVPGTQEVWVTIWCVQIPKDSFNPKKKWQKDNQRELVSLLKTAFAVLCFLKNVTSEVELCTFLLDAFLICRDSRPGSRYRFRENPELLKNGQRLLLVTTYQRCHCQLFILVTLFSTCAATFFFWYWGLNSEPWACYTDALPCEPCPQPRTSSF